MTFMTVILLNVVKAREVCSRIASLELLSNQSKASSKEFNGIAPTSPRETCSVDSYIKQTTCSPRSF